MKVKFPVIAATPVRRVEFVDEHGDCFEMTHSEIANSLNRLHEFDSQKRQASQLEYPKILEDV